MGYIYDDMIIDCFWVRVLPEMGLPQDFLFFMTPAFSFRTYV